MASSSVIGPFLASERLAFFAPDPRFAEAVFERFASDAEVTRYVGWPRHAHADVATAVLERAQAHWKTYGFGPLLITARDSGRLVGSTGLTQDDSGQVSTGYVLARDVWGHGYATEALGVVVAWARSLNLRALHATCHANHVASRHVLEKCGFRLAQVLSKHMSFPNLGTAELQDLCLFALQLQPCSQQ